MNIILFIIIAILYALLIGLTFGNMKVFDVKTKIIYIIFGVIVNFIITYIVVSVSKINIQNEIAYKFIKNIDVLILTAVNSIITLPTFGRYVNNTKMEIMTTKSSNKKILILFVVFFIILILEINYLKGLKI